MMEKLAQLTESEKQAALTQVMTLCNLRSSRDTLLLQIPSIKTKITIGDRAFACAAPKLWNNLPLEVRKSSSVNIFKSKLKAHLFN